MKKYINLNTTSNQLGANASIPAKPAQTRDASHLRAPPVACRWTVNGCGLILIRIKFRQKWACCSSRCSSAASDAADAPANRKLHRKREADAIEL